MRHKADIHIDQSGIRGPQCVHRFLLGRFQQFLEGEENGPNILSSLAFNPGQYFFGRRWAR